jgi:hypothetical protein
MRSLGLKIGEKEVVCRQPSPKKHEWEWPSPVGHHSFWILDWGMGCDKEKGEEVRKGGGGGELNIPHSPLFGLEIGRLRKKSGKPSSEKFGL